MTRRRLDAELVRRGLVDSRTAAAQAVSAGVVRVAGAVATKPATMVADDTPLDLVAASRPYASRAGGKLTAALDRFAIDVSGLRCLDAGASTGGFTDALLQRGAAHVVAIDVGYGQLAWELRTDPRVTVLERTNVRDLTPDRVPDPPDLVTADLSFISLSLVLRTLVEVAAPGATFVVLVKPQFEGGRADVGTGGVVRDPAAWMRAVQRVADTAAALGIGPRAAMASPLPGPAGNVEFLLQLGPGPDGGADVRGAVAEGEAMRP